MPRAARRPRWTCWPPSSQPAQRAGLGERRPRRDRAQPDRDRREARHHQAGRLPAAAGGRVAPRARRARPRLPPPVRRGWQGGRTVTILSSSCSRWSRLRRCWPRRCAGSSTTLSSRSPRSVLLLAAAALAADVAARLSTRADWCWCRRGLDGRPTSSRRGPFGGGDLVPARCSDTMRARVPPRRAHRSGGIATDGDAGTCRPSLPRRPPSPARCCAAAPGSATSSGPPSPRRCSPAGPRASPSSSRSRASAATPSCARPTRPRRSSSARWPACCGRAAAGRSLPCGWQHRAAVTALID